MTDDVKLASCYSYYLFYYIWCIKGTWWSNSCKNLQAGDSLLHLRLCTRAYKSTLIMGKEARGAATSQMRIGFFFSQHFTCKTYSKTSVLHVAKNLWHCFACNPICLKIVQVSTKALDSHKCQYSEAWESHLPPCFVKKGINFWYFKSIFQILLLGYSFPF